MLNGLTYEHPNDFIVENNGIGVMTDNQLHCQGLLNLVDNKEDNCGFHLVPGFKHAVYIKLFPAITDTNRQARAEAIRNQIKQECPQFEQTQLTELGRMLFGLDPWPDSKS